MGLSKPSVRTGRIDGFDILRLKHTCRLRTCSTFLNGWGFLHQGQGY